MREYRLGEGIRVRVGGAQAGLEEGAQADIEGAQVDFEGAQAKVEGRKP